MGEDGAECSSQSPDQLERLGGGFRQGGKCRSVSVMGSGVGV